MSRPARILVLGAHGLLGEALVAACKSAGRPVAAPTRAELDLRDPRSAAERIDAARPVAVVNAAAFSEVARAELAEHRDELLQVNRDGPAHIAAVCRDRGVRFVFVSTDFVFNGRAERPYGEEAPTGPLQAYGRSKLEGEAAVREADPQTLIVRTSTLFGPGRRTRPHYVDAILDQARRAPSISVVRTPVASPTYAPDLARLLLELLDREAYGLFHVVNSGACSRLELAREALRLAGMAPTRVEERPEPATGPRRPAYSALDPAKCAALIGTAPRSWAAALAEYVRGFD